MSLSLYSLIYYTSENSIEPLNDPIQSLNDPIQSLNDPIGILNNNILFNEMNEMDDNNLLNESINYSSTSVNNLFSLFRNNNNINMNINMENNIEDLFNDLLNESFGNLLEETLNNTFDDIIVNLIDSINNHEDSESDLYYDDLEDVKITLSEADFNKLENSNSSGDCNCSICLESFSVKEILKKLPCMHIFHTECIQIWLTEQSNKCPICRSKVC